MNYNMSSYRKKHFYYKSEASCKRKEIFQETLDFITTNKEKYGLNKHIIKTYRSDKPYISTPTDTTLIKFVNMDTLDCVMDIINKTNRKVSALVMASERSRGGGVVNGALAQEEDVARRSDFYPALFDVKYPLDQYETIAIKNCQIIRKNEANEYKFLDSPYSFVALNAPAFRRPAISTSNGIKKFKYLMRRKIRILLNASLNEDCKDIVLSAWGCGAFKNPPELVAECFKEEINENYKNKFKTIIFAIIDNSKSDNLNIFKTCFSSNEDNNNNKDVVNNDKVVNKEVVNKETKNNFPSINDIFNLH